MVKEYISIHKIMKNIKESSLMEPNQVEGFINTNPVRFIKVNGLKTENQGLECIPMLISKNIKVTLYY